MTTLAQTRLGDLCRIEHGFAFKGDSMHEGDAGPVVVNIGNFRYEGGFRFGSTRIQRYGGEYPSRYELAAGEVLLVMTCQTPGGEILGIPARVPDDGEVYLHNQRLGRVVITNPERLDLDYAYYLFLSPDFNQHLVRTATGAKILHTAPSRIEDFRFALPPLAHQRSVGRALRGIDDLIENNLRRIRVLEETASDTYRNWFLDAKQPQAGPGWAQRPLGDCVENFDARRKPLSGKQRAEMKGEFPYYGAARVIDSVNDYLFDGYYLLIAEDGSVVDADDRPVLQIASGRFWVNNHTHVLQGANGVSTNHLYLALKEVNIRPYITGAAQPKITQANLNRIPIVVGPAGLMRQFDERISPMFDLILALTRRNATLRNLRDLLLPKLLSGEVDVARLPLPAG